MLLTYLAISRPGEVYEYNKVTHIGLSLYEHMPSRMPAQAEGWCRWSESIALEFESQSTI